MERKKNIPVLRFPEFSEEWKYKKIKEFTKRVSEPIQVEEQKLYQQIGIRSHGKGLFHKELVDGQALGNKRVFWVKENALIVNIVFAWEQAIAKTSAKEVGMIASHRFPMYLPFENQADITYLLYFFLTEKGKSLLELASPGGAGRNKTLGQKEFENLRFLIPSQLEQQKIADYLSVIDEKLRVLKKKKSLLEQYKKGVMQKIFFQEIRFKDDNGTEFQDWERKKLGEICKIAKSGGTPTSSNKNYYNGKIPFLSISDMTKQGKYLNFTTNKISEEGLNNSSSWIVPVNSIIYSMYASVGFVAINKIPLATSQAVLNLVIYDNNDIEFIYYSLLDFQKKIAKFITTGTQGNLNAQTVKGFEVNIPCLAEQTKIANFLSAIDVKIHHCQIQIEKTEQYKRGLLQQIFC